MENTMNGLQKLHKVQAKAKGMQAEIDAKGLSTKDQQAYVQKYIKMLQRANK